jgi:zinc protease
MKQGAIISSCVLLLILIALFLSGDACSQDGIFPQSDILKYTLENGLVVILKPERRTPTFSAQVYVRAGSATEEEYAGSGITHLIEHMIFKGTSDCTAAQISNRTKALGADVNAYTTLDYTAFKMQGPGDSIIPLLDIFYEIIADPRFDDAELEKEKDVIRTEMRYINDNPRKYLSTQFWQTAYNVHAYRNPIIGFQDIFDTLTRADVKKYYERFYVPNNMVLVIVGDMDIGLVKKAVDESFGRLKRRPLAILPLAEEPTQIAPRASVIEYPTSKASILMGFHSSSLSDTDMFALDTLAIILGAGHACLLYEELHNRQNLVYAVNAYNYTPFHKGLFLIGATFETEHEAEVVNEIFKILDSIKKSPIKKRDIDRAKNQVISSYVFSRQRQASYAADLGVSQLLTGDIDFSDHYTQGVKSVTADDLIRVADKYITRNNMTKVSLIPAGSAQKAMGKDTDARDMSRKVSKKTLRNRIRVLVSEDKALPIASVQVCIKGGLYAENSLNNGISNVVSQMLLKGTAGRSEEDIFYAIESMGGSLSSYSGNNSFGLSLDLMSGDIKKGIDILSDVLVRPVFPKNKIRILKNDILAQIRLRDDDIFSLTEKGLRRRLFEESPYGLTQYGTPESIDNITRKDIVDFYRDYCTGPNMVVSICGDVNAQEIFALIDSRLRGIKDDARVDGIQAPAVPPLNERIDVINTLDKKQAAAMAGFRIPGVTSPERYPLQVLSSIFSGASGRLYDKIRQQKGMAYTLGVFGMAGIDIGSFIFYAASKEGDIDSVIEDIFSQIELVNRGDVTDEEIASAKRSLIAQYHIGLQTAGDFAQKIALDELYGMGFQHYLLYPGIIEKISKNDVIQLSNKYLMPGACVVSKTVPGKKED